MVGFAVDSPSHKDFCYHQVVVPNLHVTVVRSSVHPSDAPGTLYTYVSYLSCSVFFRRLTLVSPKTPLRPHVNPFGASNVTDMLSSTRVHFSALSTFSALQAPTLYHTLPLSKTVGALIPEFSMSVLTCFLLERHLSPSQDAPSPQNTEPVGHLSPSKDVPLSATAPVGTVASGRHWSPSQDVPLPQNTLGSAFCERNPKNPQCSYIVFFSVPKKSDFS